MRHRLFQARAAAGLSLRALAERVGLSHTAIQKYENGLARPQHDILVKLAKALKVSLATLHRPLPLQLDNPHTLSELEKRLSLYNLFPTPFTLPPAHSDPELYAEQLRDHWQLGHGPIGHLIHTLENLGLIIVPHDNTQFIAPNIILLQSQPADLQRLSLLTHLFQNAHLARAFLFPCKTVLHSFGPHRTSIEWPELHFIKKQYQLPISAICQRLTDLSILHIPIPPERGKPLPPEKSDTLVRLTFRALAENLISETHAATLLSCTPTQLRSFRQV